MLLPYLYLILVSRSAESEYPHTIATAIEYPKHFGIFILHTKRYRLVRYIVKSHQPCSRGSGQSQGR
jgi:hypothetical protein